MTRELEHLPIPRPRSVTRRKNGLTKARVHLQDAARTTTDEPDLGTVMNLLWAQAQISQVLHAQTRGRLGDAHATPAREISRYTPPT